MATSYPHIFDDDDTCTACGVHLQSAQGPVGCEADDIVNPDAFLGFALTPTERSIGITTEEKIAFLFRDGRSGGPEEWKERSRAWRARVEAALGSS